MKAIIGCALLVLFVFFMGRTEISFSPFYIRMPGWQNVVGWFLHWYYRFQIDRKTKKIQEFNEWMEKQKKEEAK